MERRVGTVSRGIRGPIIREGDNLVDITVDSVLAAAESEGFELRDRDVVAITESISSTIDFGPAIFKTFGAVTVTFPKA